jgi:hypothetical protein
LFTFHPRSAYQEFYDNITVDRRQAAPDITVEERNVVALEVEAEQSACVVS